MKLTARNIIRCPGCSIPRRSRATCCHARDSPETLLRPPPQPTQPASSCQQPPWRSWSTERSTRLAWQPSWYVAGRPGSFPSTNWSCAFTNWSHQLGPLLLDCSRWFEAPVVAAGRWVNAECIACERRALSLPLSVENRTREGAPRRVSSSLLLFFSSSLLLFFLVVLLGWHPTVSTR